MGKVYLVGAGPGDEDLITIKAVKLLKRCDVVIYDRLIPHKLLNYIREDCKKVYVGKAAGNHSMAQEDINQLLVEHGKTYDLVVRLKGGDPFVFGRGGEEVEKLINNGVDFEVVPGISSAIAVPSAAGIPVTQRGISQSFHVITGHTMAGKDMISEEYKLIAKLKGTLVFLMGLSSIEKIVGKLIEEGKPKDTAVAVISNGTMEDQYTVRGTLASIVGLVKENPLPSPAIIVVGETAKLNYQSIHKGVHKIKIGIIGTKAIRRKLRNKLEGEGFQAVDVCDMKIVETPGVNELKESFRNIEEYKWILFTSQNAIRLFFKIMNESFLDHRQLSKVKFAVIGSGSRDELKKHGYYADFMPDQYTASALSHQFSKIIKKDEKVLIPRAKQGSMDLLDILNKNNVNFKEIPFYDVIGGLFDYIEFNDCHTSPWINNIDCFVFASASGVNSFFKEINKNNYKLPLDKKIACIGNATEEAVNKTNYQADIIANVCDTQGLASKLKEYYKNLF